jgi:lysine 2,3-aminomutase
MPNTVKPRGNEVLLPHGGLPEVIAPYMVELIEKTGGTSGPIGLQFVAQPEEEKKHYKEGVTDPLSEDEHEVAPGLVYKYEGQLDKDGNILHHGRVLWTVSRFCGSYCRFCTRGREVGLPQNTPSCAKATIAQNPLLSDKEIEEVFHYLKDHKEINEVLVSGGDPFAAPKEYLTRIFDGLAQLQKEGVIDIVRLGTRLPISNPRAIQDWHYEVLSKVKNPYLMIHLNHPAELTDEVLEVLYRFRRECMATVMSQSVLLKGVNDSVETLYELFVKAAKEGIRPYYIYQNDPVYWAQHLTVPIEKAIEIWGELRPKLSGVAATARFVIDTPFGFGKVPLPEGNAWKVDYSGFFDYKHQRHELK